MMYKTTRDLPPLGTWTSQTVNRGLAVSAASVCVASVVWRAWRLTSCNRAIRPWLSGTCRAMSDWRSTLSKLFPRLPALRSFWTAQRSLQMLARCLLNCTTSYQTSPLLEPISNYWCSWQDKTLCSSCPLTRSEVSWKRNCKFRFCYGHNHGWHSHLHLNRTLIRKTRASSAAVFSQDDTGSEGRFLGLEDRDFAFEDLDTEDVESVDWMAVSLVDQSSQEKVLQWMME